MTAVPELTFLPPPGDAHDSFCEAVFVPDQGWTPCGCGMDEDTDEVAL